MPVSKSNNFTVLLTGKNAVSPTDIRVDVSNLPISQAILIILHILNKNGQGGIVSKAS